MQGTMLVFYNPSLSIGVTKVTARQNQFAVRYGKGWFSHPILLPGQLGDGVGTRLAIVIANPLGRILGEVVVNNNETPYVEKALFICNR